MIYTASSVHRAGLDPSGVFLKSARQGVDFLLDHFWDEQFWGWYWTTERDGKPINESKLTYGQSFVIYALSEYGMASGDQRGLEWAIKTYEVLQTLSADNGYGGYYEFLERDFTRKPPHRGGGDRKSFDIHMHLMEAYTNLYEATGANVYKQRTQEMVDLIFSKIVEPESGVGLAQFSLDWKPVRAIIFDNVWGADRDVDESDEGRPLDNTSYGHNVEFAWLLGHTINILGLDADKYKEAFRKIYDHAFQYGVDWEKGGIFCEGPMAGPARERNKEFWQQAEALVGFLDAYIQLGDEKYIDAYEKIHRFVMDTVVNKGVGEWFPLFDENNTLLWDYMAHAWKINYHTVRSMIQSEKRLHRICG